MDLSKKTDGKGFGFEYTVSNMFQSQGYFTRRGVPLQYGIGSYDATDIDVLGIMFTSPFQGHRIICDCKNKVRSKPYERIFWAKGLGEFVGASNVFVALNKTQWEVIRFASSGGVKVLTSDILSEYVSNKPAYGLADGAYYQQYESIVEKIAKKNDIINNIFTHTKKLYLNENPYLVLNIAIAYLQDISEWLQTYANTSEQDKTLKYLLCELTVIVGLQLLWICSDVLGLPERARREHIINKLTFGDMEPKSIKNIMDTAKDLANEIIKSSVPKAVAPREVDFGEITPPPYSDSLIGLVDRALARPQIYLSIPQLLDFLLFEEGLKGKDYNEDEFTNVFGYKKSDERLKAARNILAFVRDACGLDWKNVWETSPSHSPASSSAMLDKGKEKSNEEKNLPETLNSVGKLVNQSIQTPNKQITNKETEGKDSKRKS